MGAVRRHASRLLLSKLASAISIKNLLLGRRPAFDISLETLCKVSTTPSLPDWICAYKIKSLMVRDSQ